MPRLNPLATLAAVAVPALVLAACGSSGSGTSAAKSGGPPAAISVKAHDFAFDPISGSVPAGSTVTVTFTNSGPSTHSLTLDSGDGETDIGSGMTGTVTFVAPSGGTIAFHCKHHASMTGSITVAGSGAGAGGSSSSSAGGSGTGATSSGYGY